MIVLCLLIVCFRLFAADIVIQFYKSGTMAHFSLSWDAYKQSICSGLSALQQNGEFVDMTLAADGYHVKVHQMIMCLVSPYIKELISSAQCPHPVIFLNKISYSTLCSILEYVYTGEVLVAKEHLTALIEAGKELHIKGLEDMENEIELPHQLTTEHSTVNLKVGETLSESMEHFIGEEKTQSEVLNTNNNTTKHKAKHAPTRLKQQDHSDSEAWNMPHSGTEDDDMTTYNPIDTTTQVLQDTKKLGNVPGTQVHFTISIHGVVQMILNRYIYNLRYTGRKGGSGHRQWRCVNYYMKCPAAVVTRNEFVVKRFGAHNHPYHDKKILKKVRDNAVFTALHDAEKISNKKKLERSTTINIKPITIK